MARSASSDAPDQRPTEMMAVGRRWAEFSSSHFRAACDDEVSEDTMDGPLLPPIRIVIGKPVPEVSDEAALREVVDVLGGALSTERRWTPRQRGRWWMGFALGGALAAIPLDVLQSTVEQALALGAESVALMLELLAG
jgi:hypothetical protein